MSAITANENHWLLLVKMMISWIEQASAAKSDRINKYIIKLLQKEFKSLDQHLCLNNYHSK